MPRIFRTLENRGDRSGFDTIMLAAVTSFAELRRPTPAHMADLSRLVSPLWDKLGHSAKRAIVVTLSRSPQVPRPIVERILAEPAEIAAPFLLSSPCLTADDLERSAAKLDGHLQTHPSDMASPPENQTPVATTPLPEASSRKAQSGSSQAPLESAAAARDALRALAARSTRRPVSRPELPKAPAPEMHDPRAHEPQALAPKAHGPINAEMFLGQARSGNRAAVCQLLVDSLGLAPATATLIEADGDGRRLAEALKALDLPEADAMTIIMLLCHPVGHDYKAFERLREEFATMTVAECRTRLGLPATASPASTASGRSTGAQHQSQFMEARRREPAAPPRAVSFGRRSAAPGSGKRLGNG
ncbi:DUF2336 domain-containing protein [Jiella marina]|uniref:DUF2336 domain-containing protein n=1 Tax=Jiella sp. LLJ827 TaxID=2917712 RepID=UPI0021019EA5|nr:DUF2336 domain-containing protein [Jiella sp. LLJ827]MCQ0989620.1 DUF2336 domain-containing protein [Jiella sp. LLJ827]